MPISCICNPAIWLFNILHSNITLLLLYSFHDCVYALYEQVFWADNPRDLQLLRHDKSLHTIKTKPHLRNVPDYLGLCSPAAILCSLLPLSIFLLVKSLLCTYIVEAPAGVASTSPQWVRVKSTLCGYTIECGPTLCNLAEASPVSSSALLQNFAHRGV